MRRDVVDHLRRLTAHDADGMRREVGGAFRLPLARIATLARRRAILVVPRLALTVGLFAALATDACGNHLAAAAEPGRKRGHWTPWERGPTVQP